MINNNNNNTIASAFFSPQVLENPKPFSLCSAASVLLRSLQVISMSKTLDLSFLYFNFHYMLSHCQFLFF